MPIKTIAKERFNGDAPEFIPRVERLGLKGMNIAKWIKGEKEMKKIMIDNRNGKIIAFALVAVLLLIGTVGLASADATGIDKGSGGLVAYYPFNGDAKDKSGNGNDGTVYGATWVDKGACGKALSFDGVDDYVEVPYPIKAINAISMEAWIYPKQFAQNRAIISKWDGTGYGVIHFELRPDRTMRMCLRYGSTADIVDFYSTETSSLNQWVHVVETWDGESAKIYFNGVEAGSASGTGTIRDNEGMKYWIGSLCGMDRFFNGLIDEVRIYNYAKTQSQIQEDMRKCTPSTPTATGEPTPATPTKTITPEDIIIGCDSTARAVIKAVGGCEAIDKSKYPTIYEVCCSKITKEYLLELLNEYLAGERRMGLHEWGELTEVLNAYLEMRP